MNEKNSGYMIEKLAELPYYTEGPAVDSRGNIYFTTLSGGGIFKLGADGEILEWARSQCPNGQCILPDDEHLVCDSRLCSVRRYDPGGKFINNVVDGYCAGEKLYSPNDVVADSQGNIYFTDSIREKGKVFFVAGDGRQRLLAGGLDYPNGLTLSPDMQLLWVAESYKNRIITIDLHADAVHKHEIRNFALLPSHPSGREEGNLPDGMALDPSGALWVAHYGMGSVVRLTATGQVSAAYHMGLPLTSNLCFTGGHTAVVTGGHAEPGPGGVYKLTWR